MIGTVGLSDLCFLVAFSCHLVFGVLLCRLELQGRMKLAFGVSYVPSHDIHALSPSCL